MVSILNVFGNGYGYMDYKNISLNFIKGDSYIFNFILDIDVVFVSIYWWVWVDFNNDNDFIDVGE